MENKKIVEWVLRIGVAGEFLGHGILAIEGKKEWVSWIIQSIHVSDPTATMLLLFIGVFDTVVALIILIKPMPIVLLWAGFWGFLTALVRPLVGIGWLHFIERSANWAAPLALLFLLGFPKSIKELFF